MTSPPTFSLIDEPWIRVRMMSGTVEDRSVRAVLADAGELSLIHI